MLRSLLRSDEHCVLFDLTSPFTLHICGILHMLRVEGDILMNQFDTVAIANLSDEERAQTMGELFKQLSSLSADQQMEALRPLIQDMAQRANDEEYFKLCQTNLTLAAALPDAQLKPFLANRMKASASLPAELTKRDMQHVQEAISKVDSTVREKITRNM